MDEKIAIQRALEGVIDNPVVVRNSAGHTVAEIHLGSHAVSLRVAWLPHGWTSDVQELDPKTFDIVVAPRFSGPARDALRARGIGWVDGTGGASLRADGLRIELTGEREAPTRESHRSYWSPLAVRAAEVTLTTQPERISTAWLADAADSSTARAGRILQMWDAAGWTAKRGGARGRGAYRELDDASGLLRAWTNHLAQQDITRWYAHGTERDTRRLAVRVADALGAFRWAWTGWFAAEHLAPTATHLPSLQLRIDAAHPRFAVADALHDAGLRLTQDAGRVELWLSDGTCLDLADTLDGARYCPWPQVYADLWRLGGRGEDAAEHLRDVMRHAHE